MLTSGQIRAARALLDWSQQQLADESGVSLATVRRIESERGPERSTVPNRDAIQRALEKGGIIFMPKNSDGGAGVRLKR
ncbi:helix-turn-helix transcriptional regulator [Vitreimonas sp.]|uniref:helix-turn-helix domain-containing protein n=1 Tax=Vitreimonas sp. TaxID=3069702 RepID=UPI002EDA4B3F